MCLMYGFLILFFSRGVLLFLACSQTLTVSSCKEVLARLQRKNNGQKRLKKLEEEKLEKEKTRLSKKKRPSKMSWLGLNKKGLKLSNKEESSKKKRQNRRNHRELRRNKRRQRKKKEG